MKQCWIRRRVEISVTVKIFLTNVSQTYALFELTITQRFNNQKANYFYNSILLKMEHLHENSAHNMITHVATYNHTSKSHRSHKNKPAIKSFSKLRRKFSRGARKSSTKANGFSRANWELAIKNTRLKSNRYYKEKEMGMMTAVQHFKIYGAGVSLFFEFQRYLILAFLIMSLFALIPTIINYVSGSNIVGQGTSLAYYFAGTTIGNYSVASKYSPSFKWVNTITDSVVIQIFIVFYFFWLLKGPRLTQEIKSIIKLKSYNVIELVEFAQGTSVEQVGEFMGRFGRVCEVAAVRNYSETIGLSKKIYELQIELKQLQISKQQQQTAQYDADIADILQTIVQQYKELLLCDPQQKEEIIKFYVKFAQKEQRQNALQILQNYPRSLFDCCHSTPPQFLVKGERITVQPCHTEPTDILWENQHVDWSTRWLRALIQYILLFASLAVGFLIISLLNILAPPSTTSINTSSYTSTTILLESNTTIVQSWCISNEISILQSGSSSTIYNYCWSFIVQYFLKILITVGISVVVVIIKVVLKKFIMFLARFKRYKTQSEQSRDMVFNLFLAYLATTVMITFLLQAFIFGISFKGIVKRIISNDYLLRNSESLKQYNDFVAEWYLEIGYQLALNVFTMAIHPCLSMPLVLYLMQKISLWRAAGEQVQANMQRAMQPAQFEFESNYADLLVIIFVGVAFSGGMPVITIICLIAITFRYFYFKYLFFRHCKIPNTFDEALNDLIVAIIPIAIFLHFAFSIWMFGVTTIFHQDTSLIMDLGTSSVMQSMSLIVQRIFRTYHYSTFFALILIIWVFKTGLCNFLKKLLYGDDDEEEKHTIIPVRIRGSEMKGEFMQPTVSSKSLCDSYKMENNPDYVQVLQIMKKKRRFVLKLKKDHK